VNAVSSRSLGLGVALCAVGSPDTQQCDADTVPDPESRVIGRPNNRQDGDEECQAGNEQQTNLASSALSVTASGSTPLIRPTRWYRQTTTPNTAVSPVVATTTAMPGGSLRRGKSISNHPTRVRRDPFASACILLAGL
jgi:hypothetical protein